jgi:hypothetical protein
MSDGIPTTAELMAYSRRALADTVTASMAQVVLLQKELAVAQWQANLLAGQRDHLLRWCEEREEQGTVRIWDVYSILIRDPADDAPKE